MICWLVAEHHSSAMPKQKPAGVEEMFDKWNAARLQVGYDTTGSGVTSLCAPCSLPNMRYTVQQSCSLCTCLVTKDFVIG
jgi:hypothetical protein